MENEVKNSFRSGYTKGVGFGVLLILLGSIFLGFQTGLISGQLERVIVSWPMLLIFIGIVNLFKRHWISGIILIVIGKFFLIPRIIEVYPNIFPGLNSNFAHIYWPLLFILAGILILLQRFVFPQWGFGTLENKWQRKYERHQHRHYRHHHRDYSNWSANTDGFSRNSVFGSGEHIVLDPEFKGGDLNAVFGGITIYVPTDWFVETHLDAIFGGFQDNRMPKEPLDTTKKLIITGSCVFGGGELRN